MEPANHNHQHAPNRFAVIPTPVRLRANTEYSGDGVVVAFLDSGFYPHPDLVTPVNRIITYHDIAAEQHSLSASGPVESWHWHGTQTSVAAAGNGRLSDGLYRGLAHESKLVLVKVSERGRITEENIARGIRWVIANRDRYNIRILNISLGGDEDVPCSKSIIDQAAEEAISCGIVVVAAAGNSGAEGRHSIPPANSPSVITVGGYSDNNELNGKRLDLYHSNFGVTADGTVKPEIVAPAMWIAAPILPGTRPYELAEALSLLAAGPDVTEIRPHIEATLQQHKIVAAHYQHVDGTSFAAPIVTSIVAQMIEANSSLTPGAIKNILISTADRIVTAPVIRQGFGVVNAKRAVELAKTEQHALNVTGCKPPRVENGRLLFVFHDDEAASVAVAGDFNGWNQLATPLKRNSSGLWTTEIEVPRAGRFEYKFVVNGQRWLEDPSNGMKAPDSYGGLNSVIVIE
ncbi:MAG TPA: S8 family serine peptidase [Pyrinomonadaceae bacterium]|nr:S8 family serine peptidase [Pyrinomonadaceae bacterium]